ncbi:hypothetical protein C8Q77DRAFT_476582 [Trametes polyzona]|nr:hypothetical protein C8Q77DRAFT_476582 [Trametes polyzona]
MQDRSDILVWRGEPWGWVSVSRGLSNVPPPCRRACPRDSARGEDLSLVTHRGSIGHLRPARARSRLHPSSWRPFHLPRRTRPTSSHRFHDFRAPIPKLNTTQNDTRRGGAYDASASKATATFERYTALL